MDQIDSALITSLTVNPRMADALQKLETAKAVYDALTPEQKAERRRAEQQRRRAEQHRLAGTPRINIYTCTTCGGQTVTVDVDDGVTPFAIQCRATERCRGDAHSCFYRVPPGDHKPTFEWYKPTIRKAKRMDRKWPGTLEHVQQGGLMLRPRTDAAPVLHQKPE